MVLILTYMIKLCIDFLPLVINCNSMAYERIKPITDTHQAVLKAIGDKIQTLRKSTGLSVERFCAKNDIPRISYSSLESGKNFHMTTLLAVLSKYPEIKSLSDFFRDL